VKGRAEAANVEGEQARPQAHATKLGKYQLLAILGRGGMADVFLALSRGPMGFDKLVSRQAAARGSLADDDAASARMFLDEARLAARLNHPNVVHTYEVGAEHDGTYYIAMEYLEGQALNKIINESPQAGRAVRPQPSRVRPHQRRRARGAPPRPRPSRTTTARPLRHHPP
jgi:serine/threonine protein kinase